MMTKCEIYNMISNGNQLFMKKVYDYFWVYIFSLVRPDSWTPDVERRGRAWDRFAHLRISLRILKVDTSMRAQKNRNKNFLKRVQKFFWKKYFFDQKNSKNLYFWPFLVEKMAKKKIFGRKFFFWSESIQNGPKRILKRKSRFRKFFSIVNCLSHFSTCDPIFRKMAMSSHNGKKFSKSRFSF